MYYILDDNNEPRQCSIEELTEWSAGGWQRRRVAESIGPDEAGRQVRLSTVFLTCEHGMEDGRPVLFETMLFDEEGYERGCWRYTTWASAEEGHRALAQALSLPFSAPKPKLEPAPLSTARRLRIRRR